MEHLTKQQIVLLTLLVSFVTSIATGIVTVTLLDQAPPEITKTINQVVERTIERVVPDETRQAASVVTTTEKTVVVKEEDLITESIQKNTRSIVHINSQQVDSAGNPKAVPIGIGIIVSSDGLVATDAGVIVSGGSYSMTLSDGLTVKADIVDPGATGNPIALIKAASTTPLTLTPVKLADASSLKIGQTVIVLSGVTRVDVGIGIISSLVIEDVSQKDSIEKSPLPTLTAIETTISKGSVLLGSPLINIFGDVVGIQTEGGSALSSKDYTPATAISASLSTISLKKTADKQN